MYTKNEFTSDQILEELGIRIKERRSKLGWTQTDLADKCGFSLGTMVRIESGKDSKLSNYISIFKAFGIVENMDVLVPQEEDYKALFEQERLELEGKGYKYE